MEPWVTTDLALAQFSTSRPQAVDAYRRFVDETARDPAAQSPLLECNANDRRILGTDDFARTLLGDRWTPKSRKSIEVLIGEACAHFNCTPTELGSKSRNAQLVAARAWVAHEAVAGRVASIAEIARRFNRDESSLRHALETHTKAFEVFPVSRPGTE